MCLHVDDMRNSRIREKVYGVLREMGYESGGQEGEVGIDSLGAMEFEMGIENAFDIAVGEREGERYIGRDTSGFLGGLTGRPYVDVEGVVNSLSRRNDLKFD